MQTNITLSGICGLALLGAGFANGASLSHSDQQFMDMAATTNMTEANEGQMAENQANRPDIKDFAKTLVQDHTQSYQQLSELANKLGVTIPTGINTGKDRNIQQLAHLKGASFDAGFCRDEVADHRKVLAEFKHEAADGQNADVKAYANATIPTLEKHLQMAEDCAKANKRS